jgi:predicted AAA+ superfamily ATPase
MLDRWFLDTLKEKLSRPYVHILFGARQTGKSTLINALLPENSLKINLADPMQRNRHVTRPQELTEMCRSMPHGKKGFPVFIDEAQSVPSIFDTVQYLYDEDKERWRFILCGSSARRLRKTGTNLLPGRSILHRLYPLTMAEQPPSQKVSTKTNPIVPLVWRKKNSPAKPFDSWDLETRMAYGSLPGVVTAPKEVRSDILKTYAVVHLEEEIRREAYVKDWPAFVRFVHFAAAESGKMTNYASISNQTGISLPTVKAYYQLLEDMFVGFSVPAFTRSTRKNILSTSRFFMFDLGVRHAAAGLNPSLDTVRSDPGPIFEQWVGIELWKRLQYLGDGRLSYQKIRTGAEIDFIVEHGKILIPIEVKWTEKPTLNDARHVLTFLD